MACFSIQRMMNSCHSVFSNKKNNHKILPVNNNLSKIKITQITNKYL